MLELYGNMQERRKSMHDWRLPENVRRKYEQAERFGLTEKLEERGWGGLSPPATPAESAAQCAHAAARPITKESSKENECIQVLQRFTMN